jgi:superoxide reductase
MAVLHEVYKCDICGNIVEVLHGGDGELVCCGAPMKLMPEQEMEIGNEKHKPVVEQYPNKVIVKVGSIPHPMEEKHFIQWIEIVTNDGKVFRKHLLPGNVPEAEFPSGISILKVREYCNIHGLWQTK